MKKKGRTIPETAKIFKELNAIAADTKPDECGRQMIMFVRLAALSHANGPSLSPAPPR